MKYVGVVGTRKRDSAADYQKVVKAIMDVYVGDVDDCGRDILVSGGCSKGADRFAELFAKKNGVPILIFYPDKIRYGLPEAYFDRNDEIANYSDVLIACISRRRLGGTEDTIRKFLVYRGYGHKLSREKRAIQDGKLILV